MKASMRADTLVNIFSVLDDIWEGRVTSENYSEWWTANLGKVLDGRISASVIIDRIGRVELDVV